jgi:hypothetical protein
MGFSRHWLHDQAFVLTKVSGAINTSSLMEHVLALNEESTDIENLRELADCRELTDVSALSVSGVTQASAREVKKPGSRLVILVPKESPVVYGLARAYEMFAADSRESVIVSTNLDEALRWLKADKATTDFILSVVNQDTSSVPQPT